MNRELSDVDHPAHYTSDPSGIECIQIVRHRNFNIGNAIKYLWRAGLNDETPIYKQMMRQMATEHHMRNQYIAGMDVDDIATANQCDTWKVQHAILGAAYGRPQQDVTG